MSLDPRNTLKTVLVKAPSDLLCLDFANTRFWRGTEAPTEQFSTFTDVTDWARKNAALLGRRKVANQAADFAAALALREAIYRAFLAIAEAKRPRESDLAALALPAGAPRRLGIVPRQDGYAWRVEAGRSASVEALLAPVLWSTWDLLVGPRRAKVRRCANDQCLWLFVDESKSGTRRWCSMASCGNRAKAHRHYRRKTKR
jgi:predicted RNA-binding Zn ribbon-like protein